ncbi:Putative metal-dependent hydrolase YfiT [Anatilimnocola aggregata]|uniref:Metal-dependent hydrolase YfiT n=1 Tax=Anatilimnocola aggregata TaxID=2528021 RepID=A0A517YIG6_9BACT|nr:DinB family protein [Anatilimnocola aggregata]QDU30019.1 Putative metal-dependent hydrolase YfiT [Anatilimnocola aggregata]
MSADQLIERYLAGPALLRQAVAGMTREQLLARPVAGKWSTLELVAHIADFEPVYLDRMKRTIAQHEPTMFSGDPDLFASKLAYHERDLEEELNLIAACRTHMGRILKTLPADAFHRCGIHTENGPMTLEKILTNIANHIPHHLPFVQEKRQALGV